MRLVQKGLAAPRDGDFAIMLYVNGHSLADRGLPLPSSIWRLMYDNGEGGRRFPIDGGELVLTLRCSNRRSMASAQNNLGNMYKQEGATGPFLRQVQSVGHLLPARC